MTGQWVFKEGSRFELKELPTNAYVNSRRTSFSHPKTLNPYTSDKSTRIEMRRITTTLTLTLLLACRVTAQRIPSCAASCASPRCSAEGIADTSCFCFPLYHVEITACISTACSGADLVIASSLNILCPGIASPLGLINLQVPTTPSTTTQITATAVNSGEYQQSSGITIVSFMLADERSECLRNERQYVVTNCACGNCRGHTRRSFDIEFGD